MGWKASVILINPCKELNQLELLTDLGFKNLKKIDDEYFEVVMNPQEKKVYIGNYNDSLLIAGSDLPLDCFGRSLATVETVLISKFPDAEIFSFALQSVVDFWGYSILKNGKKLRMRAGNAEYGIVDDIGEPLLEEEGMVEEADIDGEELVFRLTKRYLGEQLDCADKLLFETKLNGYQFE